MELNVKVDGLDEVAAIYARAPAKFNLRLRGFMDEAVALAEREVVKDAPVSSGKLRKSIAHEIRGLGAELQGIVSTPQRYAPPVESGTKPHWPLFKPVRFWVMHALGARGAELRNLTFLVRRAIARRGTPGAHMFERAFVTLVPQIWALWDRTWDAAIQEDL